MSKHDPVTNPKHYTSHPSGVEFLTIGEHFTFNVGCVIKYAWRSGLKDGTDPIEDMRKCAFYAAREVARLEALQSFKKVEGS